jgi:hypothetical protein
MKVFSVGCAGAALDAHLGKCRQVHHWRAGSGIGRGRIQRHRQHFAQSAVLIFGKSGGHGLQTSSKRAISRAQQPLLVFYDLLGSLWKNKAI